MKALNDASRVNGLDTLRALAITFVFAYHYQVFVSGHATFGWLSTVGWVGVDLFFVLSGYLIGHQLFAGLARHQSVSLLSFYGRRALRTWPVFWLVLALYFLFPTLLGGREPPALWRFLTFTQNYQLQPGTAFSHAWSLCIEEQFYLVLPLVVLAARRVASRRRYAWMLLGGLMATAITARAVLWLQFGRESTGHIGGYYPNVYYATLCRFDEFLPGIAVAMVQHFHPGTWARLQRSSTGFLAAAIAPVLAMLYGVHSHYYIDGYGYPFFMSVFGYSLVAATFALLVASALSARSPLHTLRIPGAYSLAVWSYSIYLSHKGVAYVIQQYARQWHWGDGLTLGVIAASSVATGALLYRVIEAPFMALRGHWLPALFASREQAADRSQPERAR